MSMRATFRIVSILLLVFGVPGVLLAALALFYSWLASRPPPPGMNEGPGMAGVLGWMLLLPSAVALVVGIAMHVGLNSARSKDDVEWAREHRRLW